jgi:hypothetical protein
MCANFQWERGQGISTPERPLQASSNAPCRPASWAAGFGVRCRNADHDPHRSGHCGKSLFAALLAARMQDHAVPLFDQELGRHLAEAVGSTCNKYACHNRLLSVLLQMHARPVKPRTLNVNNQ